MIGELIWKKINMGTNMKHIFDAFDGKYIYYTVLFIYSFLISVFHTFPLHLPQHRKRESMEHTQT